MYEVIKSLLPLANDYITDENLKEKINQIAKIFEVVDNMGGIEKITALLNVSNNSSFTNQATSIDNNIDYEIKSTDSQSLDNLPKIQMLD